MNTTYQIPATTHLGEVSLKISNLDRSIQFYTDVVGLKLLTRQDHIATMTAGGKNVLLRLEEVSNSITLPERSHAGLYHFAILLPDRKSLGLAIRNLVASGINIGQGDHLVSEAFYISDPDLNGIEIYADRPRDTWKRDADNNYVMASDPVDVQSYLICQQVRLGTACQLPPLSVMSTFTFAVWKKPATSTPIFLDSML